LIPVNIERAEVSISNGEDKQSILDLIGSHENIFLTQ
jgi:hypothetical protein